MSLPVITWQLFGSTQGTISVPANNYLAYAYVPQLYGVPPSNEASLSTGVLTLGPGVVTISTLPGFSVYIRFFSVQQLIDSQNGDRSSVYAPDNPVTSEMGDSDYFVIQVDGEARRLSLADLAADVQGATGDATPELREITAQARQDAAQVALDRAAVNAAAAVATSKAADAAGAAQAVGSYDTLSALNDAIGSIPANAGVYVTSDGANTGFYVKQDGAPVKKSDGTVPAIQNRTVGYDANGAGLFSIADQNGFVQFLVDRVAQRLRTDWLDLATDRFENTSMRVMDSADGLAITDGNGYRALLIEAAGKILADARGFGDGRTHIQPGGADLRVIDPAGFVGVSIPSSVVLGSQVGVDVQGGPIPSARMQVFAHMGSRVTGAPEDSLDAYSESARAGYRYVETDVQITSDGQYVMMHDESVNRTCKLTSGYADIVGTVNISATSLATLRSTYVLASDMPRFRRPIPTLEEFAKLCSARGLHPMVELKAAAFTNAHVLAVFTILRRHLSEDGFSFTSFTESLLDYARTLSTKTHLYYIYYPRVTTANVTHVAANKPASIYMHTDTADMAARIDEARAAGVATAIWTAGPWRFDEFRARGIDAIAADTVPPPLRSDQRVIWRDNSGAAFARYAYPAGALSNGVITLAAGETLVLTASEIPQVEFGACWITFDAKGAYALTDLGLGVNYQSGNVTGGDFETQSYSEIFAAKTFKFILTAGSGGCTIKDVSLALAKF